MDGINLNLKKCKNYLSFIKKYFFYPLGDLSIESRNVLILHRLLPHRIYELGTSAYSELKRNHWVSGATLSRAVGETVSITVVLNQEAQKYVNQPDVGPLIEFSTNLLFCTRFSLENYESTWSKATNILTHLERVEEDIPDFKMLYELTSEYAHPNTVGIFVLNNNNNISSHEDLKELQEKASRLAISISSILLRVSLSRCITTTLKNEGIFKKLFPEEKKHYDSIIAKAMKELDSLPERYIIKKHEGYYALQELLGLEGNAG